jgi:tRNA-2-methylthio-N6-dimethylallyladenosine synthase
VLVYLETMGCQMNRLDSELVAGALRAAGHKLTDDRSAADVVLYNTCSVRDHAEQKVLSRIGADGQRKASGKRLIVGVLGCMAQRMGDELVRKFPQVDVVCGPGQLHKLAGMLEGAGADSDIRETDKRRRGVAVDPDRRERPRASDAPDPMDAMDLGRDPSLRWGAGQGTSTAQAYVRVMRGCDNFCTYCIVPFVRGSERSREPDQIAAEARKLVDAGRTEITLLGQTVNRYRWAAGGRTVRFSDLLARVSAVAGLRRLRFVTSHPVDFTDDVLEAMRDLPNVCEYIHCPAQSGSDGVLAAMNRGYTRATYDDLVDRARAIVPGVTLAGDFIVGFPGETDRDHAASADLVRRSGYKNAFLFKYSPRPGTVGARRLTDDVPDEVKKRRHAELLAIQDECSRAHHVGQVGRTFEVLVEGPSPRSDKQPAPSPAGRRQMVGRTRGDHIVVFDAPAGMAGQYVDVTVTGASSLTLFGRLTDA